MLSVIVCTKRVDFLDNILSNFLRQSLSDKELILVLNTKEADVNQIEQRLEKYNIKNKIVQFSEEISLGECLNYGISLSTYETIAKLDDDDYYGVYYLYEAYNSINQLGADLVGKRSFYIYFKDDQELYLYNPNHESVWMTKGKQNARFKDTYFMSGASLVFRRGIIDRVSFPHVNVEEDSQFQNACFDQGFKIYALSKSNYVYMRYSSLHQHASRSINQQLKNRSQFLTKINIQDMHEFISRH